MNETAESLPAHDRDVPAVAGERIPSWSWILVPLLALVAASPALGEHLLGRDIALVQGNRPASAARLADAVVRPSTALAGGGAYRPLTEVSLGLDHLLFGSRSVGYHLSNLLLHLVTCLLCYLLLRLLVPPRPVVALTSALLFAIHPVHADTLFWVSARATLLCAALYLATLVLFLRGRGPQGRRRPTVPAVVCGLLAVLAHEMALTLPLMVVVLTLAQPVAGPLRARLRRGLWLSLPFAAMALGSLALRWWVLGGLQLHPPAQLLRDLFQLGVSVKFLMLPVETHAGLRGGVLLLLAALVVLVTFLRYARMGDRRNMALGLVWVLVTLAPGLGQLQRTELYLPSMGFSLTAGIVLAGLTWRRDAEHPRWLSRASGAGLALLLLGGAGLLYYQGTRYRDASRLAQGFLAALQRTVPRPAPGTTLYLVNVPAVLYGRLGDQPLLAYGLRAATRRQYGREDIDAVALTTLYLSGPRGARPRVVRLPDGSLRATAGGTATGFSFHARHFTTGRDQPRQGESVHTGGPWVSIIEQVQQGRITQLRLHLQRPLSPLLRWDGAGLQRLAPRR